MAHGCAVGRGDLGCRVRWRRRNAGTGGLNPGAVGRGHGGRSVRTCVDRSFNAYRAGIGESKLGRAANAER